MPFELSCCWAIEPKQEDSWGLATLLERANLLKIRAILNLFQKSFLVVFYSVKVGEKCFYSESVTQRVIKWRTYIILVDIIRHLVYILFVCIRWVVI